jgi:hypothetical protein
MEKLPLFDLQTGESVRLSDSKPTLVLFFSLSDILLIKEINKDIGGSILTAVSVYIGEEPKKAHLWRQQESDCMPAYNGGANLRAFNLLNIRALPWLALYANNALVLSSSLSEIGKPLIKALLHKHPEFKKSKKKHDTIEQLIASPSLSATQKIELLENMSVDSELEISQLKRELLEKDRIIRDIAHKL